MAGGGRPTGVAAGWGARVGTPGGAAARAGGSGDGEQVSEPSLTAGPVGGGAGRRRERRGAVPCRDPERRRPRSTSPGEQRRSEGRPGRRARGGLGGGPGRQASCQEARAGLGLALPLASGPAP